MAAKGQTYNWAVPDRKEVSKLAYQLRRFNKQLDEMAMTDESRQAVQAAIQALNDVLARRYES